MDPVEFQITWASLGEQSLRGRTVQVIRGVLTANQFDDLSIPEYQRIAMGGEKHQGIVDAINPEGIGIPDDILLCTGEDFSYKVLGSGELTLTTPELIVIDGHQRVHGGRQRVKNGMSCAPLGVKIILDLTLTEQKSVFYQINRHHTEVTTQVHLRNSDETPATKALRELAEQHPNEIPEVQWDQERGTAGITAHMLFETASLLHGFSRKSSPEELLDTLDVLTETIGTERMCMNVYTYFRLLKQLYPDGSTLSQYRYRIGLLMGTAILFGRYDNFWSGTLFKVNVDDVKRIGGISAIEIDRLIDRSGRAQRIHQALARHYDGLRTKNKLVPREWPGREKRQ